MIVDTNALSARAAGNASIKVILKSAERLFIPGIVLGEYYFGIRQSRHITAPRARNCQPQITARLTPNPVPLLCGAF